MRYNRIKEVLEENSLSQKWLSDQIGVSVVTVNFWCSNKSQPSIKTFFEVSKILKTKIENLLITEIEKVEMEKVVIVGSSGHSKVIIDIFEKMPNMEILGLIDAYRSKGEKTLGYEILGSEDILKELLDEDPSIKIFVAIGDNWIRKVVVEKIIGLVPKINFVSAIHPESMIGKKVKMGKGVAIMGGRIVNSDSIVGDFCIINTNSSLDHDCLMEEYSSLAPNAITGGNVKVGKFSAILISATIKHGLSLGNHTVVGAGSVVLNSFGDNAIVYGMPAKEIRKREIGEEYL